MIYVVHLYECDQKRLSLFASYFDHDGLFAEIGKDLTGHLHTQLRPHSSHPHTYLAIEFWLTEDDYRRARRSIAFRAREEWLKTITVAQCSHRGRELSRELDAGLERAGLPHVRYHDMRHSTASILISLGVPLKVIQEILGHSNFQITADTYTHRLPTQHEDAMRKMNEAFTKTKRVRPERIVARGRTQLVQRFA